MTDADVKASKCQQGLIANNLFILIKLQYYTKSLLTCIMYFSHMSKPVTDTNLNKSYKMNKAHTVLLTTSDWMYWCSPVFCEIFLKPK